MSRDRAESDVAPQPFRNIAEYLEAELRWVRDWVRSLAESKAFEQREGFAVERRRLDARTEASSARGVELPLASILERCGLSELESEILRLLVALEVDPQLEALFAKLFEDGGARTPDVRFLSGLFEPDSSVQMAVLDALSPGRALCDFHLLHLPATEVGETAKLFNRPVTAHPQLVRFVLHGSAVDLDPSLTGFVRLVRPRLPVRRRVVGEAERKRQHAAFERASRQSGRLRMIGPRGAGKRTFVETMLHWRKQSMLIVDVAHWFDETLAQRAAFDASVATLILEAMLRNAVIYLDIDGDERLEPAVVRAIERGFRRFAGMLVLADIRDRLSPWHEISVTTIEIPMPTVEERSEIWSNCLTRSGDETTPTKGLKALGHAFALTAGQIVAAVENAREEDGTAPGEPALWTAARRQVTNSLAGLADRVETGQGWNEVVLPESVRSRLSELRAFAARRQLIYDEWGFGAKFPGGRGLTALFHGLPGTGKTMVAAIIARDLGLELFRVDLSRVVSKWVGETEKNLATIFDAAERAQALLLFDEADALFSTRTEVRSANDRYGNLEVNYLLQRMEQFDGTTILTTNHASALDKAFQRRLRFRVLFPAPDATARALLWQRMIPEAAPIEPNVAWHKLAEAFDLTGGHIKNAVIRAAFRAADRGEMIRFDDLKQAAIVECSETGRLVKA